MNKKLFKATLTAMLSALAFILMFIEFSVPFMPAFIKFDISDLPPLFGAIALGPLYGVLIELLKNVLHILLKGTSSMFVGEASNFLLGSVMCLITSVLLKKTDKKHVLFCAVIGSIAMGLASIPANYFIIYPAYVVCYNLPLEAIIEMYKNILKVVSEIPTKNALLNCLLIFNFPFTAMKGIFDAVICACVYKPLAKALKNKI